LLFVVVCQFIFLLAISTVVAHLGVYFRDIRNLMQYICRALYYLSPVMFALDSIPENLQKWMYINPLTVFITSYRNVLLYQQHSVWVGLIIILLISLIVLYIGLKLLFKYDKEYAKVI